MWRMGGTRFNARGIDDDGHVANHAELEQIVNIQTVHDPPITYKNQQGEESIIGKSGKMYSFL